jgi:hypothetical protein
MPTNIQLKQSIDTDVTNKTSPASISPTNVGISIKSAIDYTDQQDLLKEALLNKSINVITDGASNTKYPSVKAIKDYVDNNLSTVKVLKTTITSAEILNIFSAPKVIVPAIAGKIIIPTHICIVIDFNNTQYSDVGGSWKIRYGSGNTAISTVINYLGSATYDQEVLQTLFYSSFTTSGSFINSPILLTTTGNNPIGGNSGINVYVTYTEITL